MLTLPHRLVRIRCSGSLGLLEQRRVEKRSLLPRQVSTLPIRQLTEVETVL